MGHLIIHIIRDHITLPQRIKGLFCSGILGNGHITTPKLFSSFDCIFIGNTAPIIGKLAVFILLYGQFIDDFIPIFLQYLYGFHNDIGIDGTPLFPRLVGISIKVNVITGFVVRQRNPVRI